MRKCRRRILLWGKRIRRDIWIKMEFLARTNTKNDDKSENTSRKKPHILRKREYNEKEKEINEEGMDRKKIRLIQ